MQESSFDLSVFQGYVPPPEFEMCMECDKLPGLYEGPNGELLCQLCTKMMVANITGMNRAERRRQAKLARPKR